MKSGACATDYSFHSIANDYDLMKDEDLERMVVDMKGTGYDPGCPVVLYEGKILDGKNRYLASKRAGVEPTFEEFVGDHDEAVDFVRKRNEERRHLDPWWLRVRRERYQTVRQMLIDKAVKLRQEGKTFKVIGKEMGVAGQTAINYVEKAIEKDPGLIQTLPKVTESNGKRYKAHRTRGDLDRIDVVARLDDHVKLVFNNATVLLSPDMAVRLAQKILQVLKDYRHEED